MKKLLPAVSAVLCIVIVILWQLFSADTNYYIVSAAILVLSMLPFFASFERRAPSARELALLSTLIAVAVVSRAVFYLVPQVKPIGAVVVASAACLGARRGYIIGAFSAFISNFIFGQGVFTPFQMVALGLVGFVSGVLLNEKSKRLPLAAVGFVLTFVLYSLIVDLSSVLMMTDDYSIASVFAVYAAALPFNTVFGVSTAVFLLLFGEGFLKKINRIIKKYGID